MDNLGEKQHQQGESSKLNINRSPIDNANKPPREIQPAAGATMPNEGEEEHPEEGPSEAQQQEEGLVGGTVVTVVDDAKELCKAQAQEEEIEPCQDEINYHPALHSAIL
eukprot:Nk52_evm9s710 gene=Nk52_evmTU9s710